MDDRHLAMYLREVVHQHRLATVAAGHLNEALTTQGVPASEAVARHFGAAQGILTAGAQVSKLLYADTSADWPVGRREFAVARAKAIRDVVKPAPILQRRAVRNSVEHLDSRLDDAVYDDPTASIVDANIAPRGQIAISGAIWLRHLDPGSLKYSALDDAVPLQDLFNALSEVAARANSWLDDHGLV